MNVAKNRILGTPGRRRVRAAAEEKEQESISVADRARRVIAEYPRFALCTAAVVGIFAGWWVKR